MSIFRGQLWLVPDRVNEISVEIFLNEERIRLVSNGTVIGDWPLADVKMELIDNDVHLYVEDEELVLWSSDPDFTPALVGVETEDNFEPYTPWEPPSGRHLKRGRRRRRGRPRRR